MSIKPCETCRQPWRDWYHVCEPAASTLQDAGQEMEAQPGVTTQTVKLRCHCGRDITWDMPLGTSLLPMCTGCGQFCQDCSCPQMPHVNAGAKSEAVTPDMAAGATRPDLEGMRAHLERRVRYASVHKLSDTHLQQGLDYAESLEQELAAARHALKSARHSLELIRDTGGSSSDRCEAEMALKMIAAALARGGGTDGG